MPPRHYFLPAENSDIDANLFDEQSLSAANKLLAHKTAGRGNVVFFQHAGHTLVLRHFCRGGLPARISRDSYFWTGLNKTRAWREFHLLKHLENCELPAPRVYAAHVTRDGFRYRADIVTHAIDDATSLGEYLSQETLGEVQYNNIGATIRRFHDAGVDHVDLNANNILLDKKQRVYLIDFDRCRLREAGSSRWQQGNLDRLLRSLQKLTGGQFSAHRWDALLRGYSGK